MRHVLGRFGRRIEWVRTLVRYLEELEYNPHIESTETLGHFVKSRGYSELFQKAYLVPMCASIWSCPSDTMMNFSAYSILSFCRNHHLLQLFGRPQWLTVRGCSHRYVNKNQIDVLNAKVAAQATSSQPESSTSSPQNLINDTQCDERSHESHMSGDAFSGSRALVNDVQRWLSLSKHINVEPSKQHPPKNIQVETKGNTSQHRI